MFIADKILYSISIKNMGWIEMLYNILQTHTSLLPKTTQLKVILQTDSKNASSCSHSSFLCPMQYEIEISVIYCIQLKHMFLMKRNVFITVF